MRDERLLVERCQQGDPDAFRRLVEPYSERLFTALCGMMGSREDAEDLLQEALLAAYRSLGSFRREASFYTWLYRVVVNRALNELKRRGRHGGKVSLDRWMEQRSVSPGALFDLERPNPEEDAARVQIRDAVHAALERLPPKYRAAIVLKDLEGFSQEEISNILSCSVGTVKSRLSRARDRLKEILRPMYEEWRGER